MTGPDPRDVAPIPYPVEEIQLVIDEPISLDERDDAPEVVAALPVQSFVTVARKLRAENRLDLVLRYASPAQIVGVFDLDAWERDRIAVARAREWLDRIVDAYREGQAERGELVELMLSTEPELWVLANAAATAIAELDEPDDDEARQRVLEDMAALRTWETPDGFFVVGVPDNELGRMALRVLEAIYADSITEGRKLISAIKWSLHAELEEDLLRWRKGRLADLGFPDWEEAMRLFSPLARDAIVRDDLDSSDTDSSDTDSSDTDSDKKAAAKPRPQTHVPPTGNLPPASLGEARDVLRRVLARLDDAEYDLRLREFLLLANELMAAQRFEPGDEALQQRAVGQAQGTLNLACEMLLAGSPADDPEAFIAARVRAVGLRQLFRFGYGPLAKLRKAALALHRAGQVSLRRVGSLLDRPWGPALASLSRWYPELPVEGKSADSRPLRGLDDLARATALIGEAGALAQLTFAPAGYAVDPIWLERVDEPERLHLGDLVRTSLILEQLPGTPSAPGLRPLTPDDLAWAADNLLDGNSRPVPALIAALQTRAEALGVGDHAAAVSELVLARLAVELAGLERHEDGLVDLTKVAGLLTIQHVGVWLRTSA
ncbi:hypothetical protein G6O69_27390 [Pseudenhygromyxa sp. WMMC2535]|uniref:DUF6178 family protein n=1 Tax=Pseudenhygromyxa sp. WMMC2535 TaxID=2712867 RepID=UPI001555ED19|nr:hypothetical protein [Pseudenhygromyxa sp. WMMC2535]